MGGTAAFDRALPGAEQGLAEVAMVVRAGRRFHWKGTLHSRRIKRSMFPLTTLFPASTSLHALKKTNEGNGKLFQSMTTTASDFNEPHAFPLAPAESHSQGPDPMV